MAKNTEKINVRVPPSVKHSINKIPEDNSKWIRDLIERELATREMVKDEKKKKAPAQVERIKELATEIQGLEEELEKRKARLQELQETVSSLENEIGKKRNLKESIMEEVQEETDMDELMIKQVAGGL